MIDAGGTFGTPTGSTLLVESTIWDSAAGATTSSGLTGYGIDGAKRYHVFDGKSVYVQVIDSRLIVQLAGSRFEYAVVEARTGRVLRTVRGSEAPLVLVPE